VRGLYFFQIEPRGNQQVGTAMLARNLAVWPLFAIANASAADGSHNPSAEPVRAANDRFKTAPATCEHASAKQPPTH
jgi:hypothetical protein